MYLFNGKLGFLGRAACGFVGWMCLPQPVALFRLSGRRWEVWCVVPSGVWAALASRGQPVREYSRVSWLPLHPFNLAQAIRRT